MQFFINLFVSMIVANIVYAIYVAIQILKHNPALGYANDEEFDEILSEAVKPFKSSLSFLKHCLKASLMGLILSIFLF